MYTQKVGLGIFIGLLFVALVWVIHRIVPDLVLVDFTFTFYRAALYLVRGEPTYLGDFTFPADGTQHPPYNPIWILSTAIPLSVLPLAIANSARFLIEIVAIPFLAYLCARWARLTSIWYIVLLSLAPWFFINIYAGQWTVLALLGVLLCFWGLERRNPTTVAVGLWLAMARLNFAPLLILATLLYTWRNEILRSVVLVTAILVAAFSVFYPLWSIDLLVLYWDRYIHPRPEDSILLLPGWPWSQFAAFAIGVLFVIAYVWRSKSIQPSRWLWAVLVCVGLVSALHEYTYDWIVLMLPLAYLLHVRFTPILIIALYAYTFVWVFLLSIQIALPSPTIIPSAILLFVVGARLKMSDVR